MEYASEPAYNEASIERMTIFSLDHIISQVS